MLLLCVRGMAIICLSVGSVVFWVWLLAPAQQGKFGSDEYHQWKSDTATAMFGGFGLTFTCLFLGAVLFSYWKR